jgi:hypothetical protein
MLMRQVKIVIHIFFSHPDLFAAFFQPKADLLKQLLSHPFILRASRSHSGCFENQSISEEREWIY